MMQKALRKIFWFVVFVGLCIWFAGSVDHALRVETYKTCLQVPEDIRKMDCEKVLTEE